MEVCRDQELVYLPCMYIDPRICWPHDGATIVGYLESILHKSYEREGESQGTKEQTKRNYPGG